MTPTDYVHGYSANEADRLADQADTLAALLHDGIAYPAGSRVLEVGCGVGAQTAHLVASSPAAHIVSMEISESSVTRAKARIHLEAPAAEVAFVQADLFALPFTDASYDHLFVCFVLEHLTDPVRALTGLRRLLRPGGTITVIEGDHGSAFYHPASERAAATIDALVTLQATGGGNGLIGRELQPLLTRAGYAEVTVRPCTVYADATTPHLVHGFTRSTFIAMVAGVRDEAVAADLLSEQDWDDGIADLNRTAEDGGTFHYAFFRASAYA